MTFKITKFVLLSFSCLVLVNCGEENSSGVTSPPVIVVPPPTYDSSQDTTIEGQDLDNNGIRDDIDTFIQNEFVSGSDKSFAQAIAFQMNSDILNANDLDTAFARYTKRTDWIGCAHSGGFSGISRLDELRALTVNTRPRLFSYATYLQSVSGMSYKFKDMSELEPKCAQLREQFPVQ